MAVWPAVLIPADAEELSDDVARIFEELQRQGISSNAAFSGQCAPPLDVLETDETVEIAVELPGVDPSAVRVVLKGPLVLIAGEKLPGTSHTAGDYHLVERGFGRFARAVRVATPFDGSRARVFLHAGELRIVLPRLHERRGHSRPLPIERHTPPPVGEARSR